MIQNKWQNWLNKHSVMAPRYTSYPSAARFTSMNQEEHKELLRKVNLEEPVGLYFHIPFCKSVCYFCGCSVVYTRNQERSNSYMESMLREIDLVAAALPGKIKVSQIHLGGGTPNFLSAAQIENLCEVIEDRFSFTEDAERCIELDPRTVETSHFDILKKFNFRRASMGIQDTNPDVQQAINRIQPPEMVEKVFGELRSRGMSINFDLIYGLPHQTIESFSETIEQIIRWKPDRIAMFQFAYLPELKVHQKRIDSAELPQATQRLMIFFAAAKKLTQAGYIAIGLDHFALPDDTLCQALKSGALRRNFQGYTTGPRQLIGFGTTSISEFADGYAQNTKSLEDYAAITEKGNLPTERGLLINEEDKLRKYVITKIMTYLKLDFKQTEKERNINFKEHFSRELEEMANLAEDGLVELTQDGIIVHDEARPFVRNIAMIFDTHAAEIKSPMSKAV